MAIIRRLGLVKIARPLVAKSSSANTARTLSTDTHSSAFDVNDIPLQFCQKLFGGLYRISRLSRIDGPFGKAFFLVSINLLVQLQRLTTLDTSLVD